SRSNSGHGVFGIAPASSGFAVGVWGQSASTGGAALLGLATATSGHAYGIYGESYSPDGFAGYFVGNSVFTSTIRIGNPTGVGSDGWLGDVNAGARGLYAWNGAGRRVELRCNGGLNDLKSIGAPLTINHDSGQDIYLCASGGNVGIGTAFPDSKLVVGSRGRDGITI